MRRALAALVVGLLVAGPAAAQTMTVHVQTIYATNTETGTDPGLAAYAQSLSQLRYSAYKRLGGQTVRLAGGGAGSMDLPGGRRLELTPKAGGAEGADLKLAVYDGSKKLVASDVRLVPGGQPVIVGGFKHLDGVLFLAIQAMR